MKKLYLLISIAVLFASCREQQEPQQHEPAVLHMMEDQSSRQYYTVRHFMRQFDFNLSAIYGNAFINKTWH